MAPETEITDIIIDTQISIKLQKLLIYTNLVKLNLKECIECINVDIRQTFNMIIHSQPARLTCCDNS